MNTVKSLLAIVCFVFVSTLVMAQDGTSILKKVDDVMYAPKDQDVKIKMVLIDKNGKETTREALSKQKGSEMRLFRFTQPSSQAGISMLSLPNDIMYLYLPAFGKERRIASHVKNQKFAGTDLSYDDMESKPFSDKYDAKLIETKSDVYVLELTPKAELNSEYSKLVATVLKSNYYPKLIKFYDKTGELIKEMNNEKIEKIGDYYTVTDFTMTDIKKNHKTRLIFSEVKFDNNFADDEFSVRKLMQ